MTSASGVRDGKTMPSAVSICLAIASAERDGLARPGLGGHQQIALGGFGFEHGGLNGSRRFVGTRGKGFGERRRYVIEVHKPSGVRGLGR